MWLAIPFPRPEQRAPRAAIQKLLDVIDSCTNQEHMQAAERYFKLWVERYQDYATAEGALMYSSDKANLLFLQRKY